MKIEPINGLELMIECPMPAILDFGISDALLESLHVLVWLLQAAAAAAAASPLLKTPMSSAQQATYAAAATYTAVAARAAYGAAQPVAGYAAVTG